MNRTLPLLGPGASRPGSGRACGQMMDSADRFSARFPKPSHSGIVVCTEEKSKPSPVPAPIPALTEAFISTVCRGFR